MYKLIKFDLYAHLWNHDHNQHTDIFIIAPVSLVLFFNPSCLSIPLSAPPQSLICFSVVKDLFALSKTLQNGIKYYVLLLRLKVWLLPLSKIILRVIQVFARINISIFFIAKWYLIILQYHNLCIYWFVKGNLGFSGYNFKVQQYSLICFEVQTFFSDAKTAFKCLCQVKNYPCHVI